MPSIPWDWLAMAFSVALTIWMITGGSWDLMSTSGHLERFYDAQAQSFLKGRVDVEPDAIRYEAFQRDGKAYGYFGPTPALMRIPLVVLFPNLAGHWSRLSMLLACLVVLAALVALFRLIEQHLPELRERPLWTFFRPVLIVAAAIGSPNFYLAAETKVYQESIAWGAAFSLAHFAGLGWYLTTRSTKWLAFCCITAFLAFHSRVSSGAGPLFALTLFALVLLLPFPPLRRYLAMEGVPSPRRAVAAITATVLAAGVLWTCLNYWKFGVWLTSQPIAMNREYTPERLAATKGELASLHNIPLTLFTYLNPAHIEISRDYPWIYGVKIPAAELRARFPAAHLDHAETLAALPAAAPELFFGAVAGAVLLLWKFGNRLAALRAPLLGSMAGCGLLFVWGYVSYRYMHDMFPWLALGAAVALAWTAAAGRRTIRFAVAAAFAAGTVYAGWANGSLALQQQRQIAPGIPFETEARLAEVYGQLREFGLSGLRSYLAHPRIYIAADAFKSGNLRLDYMAIPYRPNQPVLHSVGPPPYRVRYEFEVPLEGEYELTIRYASAEPRPVLLSIDGRPVGYACTVATGGSSAVFQHWRFGGRYPLGRGPHTLELASQSPFPAIHALRLVHRR
jgi:hypothetical protein